MRLPRALALVALFCFCGKATSISVPALRAGRGHEENAHGETVTRRSLAHVEAKKADFIDAIGSLFGIGPKAIVDEKIKEDQKEADDIAKGIIKCPTKYYVDADKELIPDYWGVSCDADGDGDMDDTCDASAPTIEFKELGRKTKRFATCEFKGKVFVCVNGVRKECTHHWTGFRYDPVA